MASPSIGSSILIVVSSLCQGDRGPGGWGYVTCFPTGLEEIGSGWEIETTPHRVEMIGAIRALAALGLREKTTPVRVVSASQSLVQGAKRSRERNADEDLWDKLDRLLMQRRVIWEWEPPDTMAYQTEAHELATRSLRKAAKAHAEMPKTPEAPA